MKTAAFESFSIANYIFNDKKSLNSTSVPLPSSRADPESFVRGDPTLTTFFYCFFFLIDEGGGSMYHYKRAIIGPPAKRH